MGIDVWFGLAIVPLVAQSVRRRRRNHRERWTRRRAGPPICPRMSCGYLWMMMLPPEIEVVGLAESAVPSWLS